MSKTKTLYKKLVPYEYRYWFYKMRNRDDFVKLRQAVYPSAKGDFSLRSYDKHSCIFVHITKSAGTSVALSLFGELPYHYTASQYRVIYGKHTYNKYFKFALARNPWDRLYSAYSYLKGGGWDEKDAEWALKHLSQIDDFNQFVLEWLTEDKLESHVHFWPQSKFICDRRSRPIIDYLAYFEHLDDDFKKIKNKLGINANLDHSNKSIRSSYLTIYTEEAKQKVAKLYKKDIELLGYSFSKLDTPILRTM